jgi:hypothetical protein
MMHSIDSQKQTLADRDREELSSSVKWVNRETGLAARTLEHSPGPAYLRQMYERPPSRYDGEPGVMDLPVQAWDVSSGLPTVDPVCTLNDEEERGARFAVRLREAYTRGWSIERKMNEGGEIYWWQVAGVFWGRDGQS